jgi:hypothetical protein
MRREALKDFLACLTERIVLDPHSLDCQIHYRIGIEGRNKVASPRGNLFEKIRLPFYRETA